MYHRESERLAEAFGWRLINPSLPGFGGSDPLAWKEISMASLARRLEAVLDHFGVERAILLGHSMGAGVAVEFASTHPERVLGIIYRDGVATPSWHHRHGLIPLAFSTVAPDVGAVADLAFSVIFDLPDLFVGRMLSTMRAVMPELRHNMKTMARTAPVASMLMEIDLTDEVVALRSAGIPVLAEWGCFDRLANAATATEFSEIAGVPVQWIPGGHSWMLARPSGQADVLRHLPLGRAFIEDVEHRRQGRPRRSHLRVVSP
jgi:pimeloyl-ACP methyl ester carboxylesterase